jgi:hypothetical protein
MSSLLRASLLACVVLARCVVLMCIDEANQAHQLRKVVRLCCIRGRVALRRVCRVVPAHGHSCEAWLPTPLRAAARFEALLIAGLSASCSG